MKLIKYIFIMLFITSVAYSQNVKIQDFSTPVSTAKQFLAGANWNWAQTGDSVTNNQFNANGNFNTFYTSLPFSWDIAINANLNQKYGDSLNASYNFLANFNKYFSNKSAAFYYIGATSNYLRKTEFGIQNRPEIALQTGLGFGRLTNATSMAKAIRIDQDMKKYAVTTAYMPKATMQKIAAIIDQESEYSTKYKATYEYKIIGDILKEIQNSGVAGDFVNSSLSYFRVREVLFGINQFINPRYYGGDIRLGVGYTVLSRNDSIPNNGFMNSQARYSIPLDLNQQLNFTLGARTPFDSLYGKLYEGAGNVNYSYNFTNKISFIAGYTLTLSQQIDGYDSTATSLSSSGIARDFSTGNHNFTAGFNFYLENNVTLNFTAGLNKLHARESDVFTNAGIIYTIF
jgi:hypothetical protein